MNGELITIRGLQVELTEREGVWRAYEYVSSSERYMLGIAGSRERVLEIATRSLSDVDELLASDSNAQGDAMQKNIRRIVDNHFQ